MKNAIKKTSSYHPKFETLSEWPNLDWGRENRIFWPDMCQNFGSIPKINHYAEPLSYALSACHLVQTVLNARAMRISFEEARKL